MSDKPETTEDMTTVAAIACPSCGVRNNEPGNGYDGKSCTMCKYDASHALDVDANQAKAEASYLFGAVEDGLRYGVNLEVRYHSYPHDSEMFSVGEALKLAVQLIDAATDAIRRHNEEFSPIPFRATDGTNF